MSTAPPARFGRVVTAMVTPFKETEGQEIDFDAAQALARWLVANGSDGLCIAGTTGEAPVLADPEHLDLIRAVVEAVDVPVIAGLTTNDTAHTVSLVSQAESLGVTGVLAVTPYYNRPSQAGLLAHFGKVAEATPLPIVLYDIPVRTGRKIESATIVELARRHENIVALKDAAGSPVATAELMAEIPGRLEVYSGDDALTLELLRRGACGVISVASHWIGRAFGELIAAFLSGDEARAAELDAELAASFSFEGSDRWPNPLPTKAIMRQLGHGVGQCRLPMGFADAELDALAAEIATSTAGLRG